MPLSQSAGNPDGAAFLTSAEIRDGMTARITGLPIFVPASETGFTDDKGNPQDTVRLPVVVDGEDKLWSPGKFALGYLVQSLGDTRFQHETEGPEWNVPVNGTFRRMSWKSSTRSGTSWHFVPEAHPAGRKPAGGRKA